MGILPRCICDPLDAMVGKYDPRCARHLGAWTPTFAPSAAAPAARPATPLREVLSDEQILDVASHFGFIGSQPELLRFCRALLAASSDDRKLMDTVLMLLIEGKPVAAIAALRSRLDGEKT